MKELAFLFVMPVVIALVGAKVYDHARLQHKCRVCGERCETNVPQQYWFCKNHHVEFTDPLTDSKVYSKQ